MRRICEGVMLPFCFVTAAERRERKVEIGRKQGLKPTFGVGPFGMQVSLSELQTEI